MRRMEWNGLCRERREQCAVETAARERDRETRQRGLRGGERGQGFDDRGAHMLQGGQAPVPHKRGVVHGSASHYACRRRPSYQTHWDRKLRLGGTVGPAVANHHRVRGRASAGKCEAGLISENRPSLGIESHSIEPLLCPNAESFIVQSPVCPVRKVPWQAALSIGPLRHCESRPSRHFVL